ncbi:mannose-1-phosphate guanylyltransferase/mannose-6-phosphate isomerase [Anaeromicrobium sediminis]|uniref:mannose-1-phosphate guanylyltransferase n=1 Tax=Anaeromicrobium sediminis TaxID=1478221 RepID=A0A267MI02_9FIRM|nr:mannose-1-phosphate guanylyltransferase/mannose-6-phosphate isomerase [Anaeromicrobium sediminis]PAB59156.1 mannose-1-phosphate guanylyltransferase/mannose-6-phosphate isomerase [Anaeromicrobium sediminis]
MINIILCGGSGTRLWPISRKLYPKQFCKFIDEESLFQKTLKRNAELCERNIVVTNSEQYFLALDQLEELNIKNSQFLLEPIGRNTAAAITLACFALKQDDIVLVTPSDHLIKNKKEYRRILEEAENLAREDKLVTFGIKPNYAETGFGYIEAHGNDVLSFKEKPDIETATLYLQKGNYYWNSGMFVFKVSVYLEELKTHAPTIFKTAQKAYSNAIKENPFRLRFEDMIEIPSKSIDYAVMEKSNKIKVVPCDIQWSDLGSFESLYENLYKDKDGNVISEKDITLNSKNNLILSRDRIVSTIDIEDLIIVDTPDALLISKKGNSHKVKEIIEKLEKKGVKVTNMHTITHRPWGLYTILEEGYRFKIKKIVVKPGAKLSLQKHYHRNEHWIVVNGTAKVIVGDKEFIVRDNEYVYIQKGEVHRLENPEKMNLEIIEIQVGDYLEEDDIVRIQDEYKRN